MSKRVTQQPTPANDEDISEDVPPPTINEVGGGEEGKLKMIVGLLKKFMGVKDLANLRLSLPASLMEPIPNLEYWTAGDRADMLISVGDSEDPLERMLAVLRFAFTIQLKFVRGKVCKPYNSVLGEHFRCHWTVPPSAVHPSTKEPVILTHLHRPNEGDPAISGFNTPNEMGTRTPTENDSDARSVKSLGSKSVSSSKNGKSSMDYAASTTSAAGGINAGPPVKVAFLCEQVSHHPPISSAYYICPEKGIEAYGVDQISAKVSGMTVRIAPGSFNKGTFIKLNRDGPGKGEEYQISNPCANVNGLLKGSFYGTISDTITVTCRGGDGKEKYRAIVEFKDESWVSKARFLLEGVVYKYNAGDDKAEGFNRIKDVPSSQVVGTLEGCWRKQINYKPKGSKESRLLVDLDVLGLVPKTVRPLDAQEDYESRKFWQEVTEKMLAKSWGEATASKQAIEQLQRDKAAERKAKGEAFEPRFFSTDYADGRARLTQAGRAALEAELAGDGY